MPSRKTAADRGLAGAGSSAVQRYRLFDEAPFLGQPERVGELSKDEARGLLAVITVVRGRLANLEAMITARLAEPDAPAEEDRLLTVQQAADRIGCKKSYVAELIRQRRIPFVPLPAARGKSDKYKGIRLSSLLAWVKAREDAGTK